MSGVAGRPVDFCPVTALYNETITGGSVTFAAAEDFLRMFHDAHPEAGAVRQRLAEVLAVDSSLYGVSDKSGRYTINGVAPGKYTMHVWYEIAKPESLANLQRTVVVDDTQRALPTVSVPVVKQLQKEHKNKYGQDYDPDAMNPDY